MWLVRFTRYYEFFVKARQKRYAMIEFGKKLDTLNSYNTIHLQDDSFVQQQIFYAKTTAAFGRNTDLPCIIDLILGSLQYCK